MKKLFLFLAIATFFQMFFSNCDRKTAPTNCPNGFYIGEDNTCFCPNENIEVYGQCLTNDSTTFFGVSEGCPCDQDSFLMRILGRTQTPNGDGQYQLHLQFLMSETGYWGQTGLYYIKTPDGHDRLVPGVLSTPNTICYIDGQSYMRRYSGEIYGNDSIVLHFVYTRPNPQNPDAYIYAPIKCKMVLRN